jgi:hypothetical protein
MDTTTEPILPLPDPGSIDLATLFNAVTTMAGNMNSQFKVLDSHFREIKDDVKQIKSDIIDLNKGLSSLNEDVEVIQNNTIPELAKDLKDKISALEQSRLEMELYSRKNNLLFFNIPSTTEENTEQVIR